MFVAIKPTACGTVNCRPPYGTALRKFLVIKQYLFGGYLFYRHSINKGNIPSSIHTVWIVAF